MERRSAPPSFIPRDRPLKYVERRGKTALIRATNNWVARTLPTLSFPWNAKVFTLSVTQCQWRLQRIRAAYSNFEGWRFAHRLGFLFKFCNRLIFTFGGWLYFSSILLRRLCVLRQLWGWCPKNTCYPKVEKLCRNTEIRLHVVEKDIMTLPRIFGWHWFHKAFVTG